MDNLTEKGLRFMFWLCFFTAFVSSVRGSLITCIVGALGMICFGMVLIERTKPR